MYILGIWASSLRSAAPAATSNLIAVGWNLTPFMYVYPWSTVTGFGTKYADPSPLVQNTIVRGIAFNPITNDITLTWASGATGNNDIAVYSWAAGWGTKYTNAPTISAGASLGGRDVSFTSTGADIVQVFADFNPYSAGYPWSAGFGTQYANPAGVATGGQARSVTFNASNTLIGTARGSTPYINVWDFTSGVGFGSIYSNPLTLPTGAGQGVSINKSTGDMALSHSITPFITAYPWSGGFGTKYANPGTLPTGTGNGVSFNPAGTAIVVAHNTSPNVSAYPWSAGFGTKYANPVTLPGLNGIQADFSADGTVVSISSTSTPYIQTYPWSAGFGTKYANPATAPTANGRGLSFNSI